MTTELLLYVRQEVGYGWHKPLNCKDSDRKLQFGVIKHFLHFHPTLLQGENICMCRFFERDLWQA